MNIQEHKGTTTGGGTPITTSEKCSTPTRLLSGLSQELLISKAFKPHSTTEMTKEF